MYQKWSTQFTAMSGSFAVDVIVTWEGNSSPPIGLLFDDFSLVPVS